MLLCALAALLGGCLCACGSDHAAAPDHRAAARPATLVLDFTPNAVHTGIYLALQRGYDRAAGVRLHVIAPSASTDAIRLLETGRADFAILDIHDLALARVKHEDVMGILPIVERPLAAVIAQPRVRSPASSPARRWASPALPPTPRCWTPSSPARATCARRGQGDHDRLQRGRRPARRPGGGRHRVLERRGRDSGAAGGPAFTSSASRTTARPPIPSWCCARAPGG